MDLTRGQELKLEPEVTFDLCQLIKSGIGKIHADNAVTST